jgi:hypothetical protein
VGRQLGLKDALPKLPLVVAGIASAIIYYILVRWGYTVNVFELEVIKALGPILVGFVIVFLLPIRNAPSRPNGPSGR